ncbi:hypothetical protein M9H77_03237 [Catharanthus roseus]|uniref:Uncharacterized protein n=1 Tax=Catharanthus roseus TaxID=4058 RepID=A0ACC0CAL8_CATRO|nr:hypothetical protein M9H77_03237 [Catharanthus roseus]
MKEIVKNEVVKLLDSGICYPISNSPWFSPIQVVPKKAGVFYCSLDGYSGYHQILVYPEDQEKSIFTCPFGTFAFRRMPFGLCNGPATFQRCMLAIFSDMVDKFLEVFMDDFSIFEYTFEDCINNLFRKM